MKKVLLLTGTILTLAACDSNIDISKYPENIQTCYNSILFDDDFKCVKPKTILSYCQCYDVEYNKAYSQYSRLENNISGMNLMGLSYMDEQLKKARNNCAEKVKLTRCTK